MNCTKSSNDEPCTAESFSVDSDMFPSEPSDLESEDDTGFNMLQENISSVCELAQNNYSSRSKHQYEMSAPYDSTSEEENIESENTDFSETETWHDTMKFRSMEIVKTRKEMKHSSIQENSQNEASSLGSEEEEYFDGDIGDGDIGDGDIGDGGIGDGDIGDSIPQISIQLGKQNGSTLLKIKNKEDTHIGRRDYKMSAAKHTTCEGKKQLELDVEEISVRNSAVLTNSKLMKLKEAAASTANLLKIEKVKGRSQSYRKSSARRFSSCASYANMDERRFSSNSYKSKSSSPADTTSEDHIRDVLGDVFNTDYTELRPMKYGELTVWKAANKDEIYFNNSNNFQIKMSATPETTSFVAEEQEDEEAHFNVGDNAERITIRSVRQSKSRSSKSHHMSAHSNHQEMSARHRATPQKEEIENKVFNNISPDITVRSSMTHHSSTRKSAKKYKTRSSTDSNGKLDVPNTTSEDDNFIFRQTIEQYSSTSRKPEIKKAATPKSSSDNSETMERNGATLALKKVIEDGVEKLLENLLCDKEFISVVASQSQIMAEKIKEDGCKNLSSENVDNLNFITRILTSRKCQTATTDESFDIRSLKSKENNISRRVHSSKDTSYDDNDIGIDTPNRISLTYVTGRRRAETDSSYSSLELGNCQNSPSGLKCCNYPNDRNFIKIDKSKESLKPKALHRKSFSFTNERVREIERHNQILLKKILSQKPTYAVKPNKMTSNSKFASLPPTTKVTTAAVNRKKQQRQIDIDNDKLKRRIESIALRRPNLKYLN